MKCLLLSERDKNVVLGRTKSGKTTTACKFGQLVFVPFRFPGSLPFLIDTRIYWVASSVVDQIREPDIKTKSRNIKIMVFVRLADVAVVNITQALYSKFRNVVNKDKRKLLQSQQYLLPSNLPLSHRHLSTTISFFRPDCAQCSNLRSQIPRYYWADNRIWKIWGRVCTCTLCRLRKEALTTHNTIKGIK